MSTETYIPTLTEHERRMRHKQPIEITPEPGKPTISQLIRRALDTGETTLSQLAQAANLSCHCIRNMRDGNPDRQKSVNYETARSIAAVLDVDDPYKIQWPCAFGDKGRPHESTGAMPIVNPDRTIGSLKRLPFRKRFVITKLVRTRYNAVLDSPCQA